MPKSSDSSTISINPIPFMVILWFLNIVSLLSYDSYGTLNKEQQSNPITNQYFAFCTNSAHFSGTLKIVSNFMQTLPPYFPRKQVTDYPKKTSEKFP